MNKSFSVSSTSSSSSSEEFLVVEWSLNKLYSTIRNVKNVKLNDIVTCVVNDIKDTGRVIYIGSEESCQKMLEKLEKIQIKKRKKRLNRHHGSKLNLPGASYFSTPSRFKNNSSVNLNAKNDFDFSIKSVEFPNTSSPKKKFSLDPTAHRFIANMDNFDTSSICMDESIKSKSPVRRTDSLPDPSPQSYSRTNPVGYCRRCKCCSVLLEQVDYLNSQVKEYERMFFLTPEVLKWFDSVRNACNTNPSSPKHLVLSGGPQSLDSSRKSSTCMSIHQNQESLENLELFNQFRKMSLIKNDEQSTDPLGPNSARIPEIVIETV